MVNPHRGELEVTLADKSYSAKVTLDSIVRMEQALGMSIVRIAQCLANAEMTVDQIVQVLVIAVRGGGNKIDKKQMQSIVWEAGLIQAMAVCGEILSSILGVEDDEGNVEGTESE